jgi:voltage-gated potassium channel
MAVGAGAGVVAGAVRLGVHAKKWPLVVAVYAAAVNFGIAEFAYLYWTSSQARRSAFSVVLSKVDAAYFSWTTFTTTGFGDVAARTQFARLAVTCEMALTFAAVAGGLSVLVGARTVMPTD